MFAQVAPGNAASLRAFLAAGFRPNWQRGALPYRLGVFPLLDCGRSNFPSHQRKRTLPAMVETAPPSPGGRCARELAAATPSTRNRYVDLLLVLSICGRCPRTLADRRPRVPRRQVRRREPARVLPRGCPDRHLALPGDADSLPGRRVHERVVVGVGDQARRVLRRLAPRPIHEAAATGAGVRRVLDRASDDRGARSRVPSSMALVGGREVSLRSGSSLDLRARGRRGSRASSTCTAASVPRCRRRSLPAPVLSDIGHYGLDQPVDQRSRTTRSSGWRSSSSGSSGRREC